MYQSKLTSVQIFTILAIVTTAVVYMVAFALLIRSYLKNLKKKILKKVSVRPRTVNKKEMYLHGHKLSEWVMHEGLLPPKIINLYDSKSKSQIVLEIHKKPDNTSGISNAPHVYQWIRTSAEGKLRFSAT